jgi:hypothetical protein
MLAELEAGFGRIEAKRAEVLGRVRALGEAERAAAPKPGEWSPLQLVSHLVLAEDLVAGQVAAAEAAGGKPPQKKPLGRFLVRLLCGTMRAAIPVPAPPGMEPPPAPEPLDVLESRWEESRRALGGRLAALTAADLARPFALHPIVGPLDARQVLDMADAHLTYHLKRFPGARRP